MSSAPLDEKVQFHLPLGQVCEKRFPKISQGEEKRFLPKPAFIRHQRILKPARGLNCRHTSTAEDLPTLIGSTLLPVLLLFSRAFLSQYPPERFDCVWGSRDEETVGGIIRDDPHPRGSDPGERFCHLGSPGISERHHLDGGLCLGSFFCGHDPSPFLLPEEGVAMQGQGGLQQPQSLFR